MIKFDGMKAEESKGTVKYLPAGPYVAVILDAKVEGKAPDQQLAIYLDIAEGPFKNYYSNKYRAQKERGSNYEIKYKGILRLRIPNPDNTKALYPESDLRRFNDMIARLSNSNPGVNFQPDGFDEGLMKGRMIGISVVEDEYNGNVFTKPFRLENVEDVREGRVPVLAKRERSENPTNGPKVDQASGMNIVTENLPWDPPY